MTTFVINKNHKAPNRAFKTPCKIVKLSKKTQITRFIHYSVGMYYRIEEN